jgi:DNA polymerase-3 subunit epsilon
MREVVLDTETTGLDPTAGHRLVEIACIELVNHVPTERHFQCYINPERDMPEDAFKVHGLSTAFLGTQPRFIEVASAFLGFVGDSKLVIHNADFDLGFLNAELARAGLPPLDRARAIDTVAMARRKFPGAQASLDALCRRFEIDNSARTLHGALLDAQLLAEVYLELIGGREPGLDLARTAARPAANLAMANRPVREPRPHAPSAAELAAHAALLERIKEPLWRR